MPSGSPDWGINPVAIGGFDLNTAELAVRLGSPMIYSRVGELIHEDNFLGGLANYVVSNPTTYLTYQVDGNKGFPVAGSLKILSTAAESSYLTFTYHIPLVKLSRYGMALMLSEGGARAHVYISISRYKDGVKHLYEVHFDSVNGTIEYRDDGTGTEQIGDYISTYGLNDRWQFIKLVADLDNAAFAYVQHNANKIDMSDLVPYATSPGGLCDEIAFEIGITNKLEHNNGKYISNLICTMSEP